MKPVGLHKRKTIEAQYNVGLLQSSVTTNYKSTRVKILWKNGMF